MQVRKGKLLAGDSGRKIAEVIDLQGAIYQRRRIVCALVCVCLFSAPLACTRGNVCCTYEERTSGEVKIDENGRRGRGNRSEEREVEEREDEWRRI